jgi:hypothetical protein
MTRGEEERARKLVEMLKATGDNHGLLVVRGSLVIRNRVTVTDTPLMFDVAALENAVTLGLLEPRRVSGSVTWDWYVAKPQS